MEKVPLKVNQGPRRKTWLREFSLTQSIGVPYYIIMAVLVLIPLFVMVLYSFQDADATGFMTSRFSLTHYVDFFTTVNYLKTMGMSILLALISTVITLIIGYPLAYIIAKQKTTTQALLLVLVTGTMWINMVLRTYAISQILTMIRNFFRPLGIDLSSILIQSNFASILGMVYMFLPFMVLPIYTVLSKMDQHYIEGAQDLGAGKVQTFMKVVLPLSLTGVLSGISLVLLPAATTLVIPVYLGPTQNPMIASFIENLVMNQSASNGVNKAAAVTIILSIAMLLIVVLLKQLDRFKEDDDI